MTLEKILILSLAFLSIGLFTSCDDDETVEIPNEEELITTLNYILVPDGGGEEVVLSFKDLDGDGGNAPEIVGGTLDINQTYTGLIELLNELESPIENIAEEVREEDDEHQLFFETTFSGISIDYTDEDENGNPLGLTTSVIAESAASGTLTITLRHEPNKDADGVSDGNIANAGGETDITVDFPIDVQ